MAISNYSRKLLWGRSGNRCAICQRELVMGSESDDRDSIVGEECHIVSGRPAGPRHDPNAPRAITDGYDNLVLLCRVHHKQVDDQVAAFPVQVLKDLKERHEQWVRQSLSDLRTALLLDPIRIRGDETSAPEFLPRLRTGKEVFGVVDGTLASSFDHDELETEEEVDIVGAFLELVRDWADLSDDLGPAEKTRVGFRLNQELDELESAGFWVFGAKEFQTLTGGGKGPFPWPVAIIRVHRNTNEAIIVLSDSEPSAPEPSKDHE